MGKTNIEFCDHVSNPLYAVNVETGKIGTFCEKPDPNGTCKNCWAEALNKRLGNGLEFDKTNRSKIVWHVRQKEIHRMRNLNAKKAQSEKFPGYPLIVFCCDTFDLWQPTITDEQRDYIFDQYDEFENLILMFQTTYVSRMSAYLTKRYPNGMPKQYWIGMSAGTQKFLDDNIKHLFAAQAAKRYLILEPLLEEINLHRWLRIAWQCSGCNGYFSGGWKKTCPDCQRQEYWCGSHQFNGRNMPFNGYVKDQEGIAIDQVIIGGESGAGPRHCDISWIRNLVNECKEAGTAVFVKQLGANALINYYDEMREDLEGRDFPWIPIGWNYRDGQPPLNTMVRFPKKDRKGGNINEFPEDLKIRQMPEVKQ